VCAVLRGEDCRKRGQGLTSFCRPFYLISKAGKVAREEKPFSHAAERRRASRARNGETIRKEPR